VPPSLHASKAIHQRNKSTPALSLMAQNAKNGNPNTRRAFGGDLSNVKAICDDSALPGKPIVQATDKKPAFAQPAQRPLSMSGVKGLLNNVTSKPVNPAGKASTTATMNNIKRTNVVFRDQLEPVVETEPSKEVTTTTQPARHTERPHGKQTAQSHVEKDDEDDEQEYFDILSEDSATEPQTSEVNRPESEMLPKKAETVKAAPAAANVGKPRVRSARPRRNSYDESSDYPAGSEVEDSEDEETRAYRFRGENTTGSTTTMIYPRATAAMKREILQAQSFVEANQTEEEIEEDFYDPSMVAEYSTEIFEYLREKEVCLGFYSSES
jgi:hypothetical protein